MAYQSHLDDPEYWRDRAEQVRALADQVSNQTARDAILRIVADYELLANEPSDSFWGSQVTDQASRGSRPGASGLTVSATSPR
jgi:hypothetical protein